MSFINYNSEKISVVLSISAALIVFIFTGLLFSWLHGGLVILSAFSAALLISLFAAFHLKLGDWFSSKTALVITLVMAVLILAGLGAALNFSLAQLEFHSCAYPGL